MPAFLEDITPFLGTGEKDEQGLTLEEYLEQYDTKQYETPSVTTDILVFQHPKTFTEVESGLKLLMIKRRNHPGIGTWALPGGFAEMRENLVDSAKRELMEETNLKGIPLEQLYTWGDYQRDPRCRIITVSFLALVEEGRNDIKAGDDAKDAAWFDVTYKKIGEKVNEKLETIYKIELKQEEKKIHLLAEVVCIKNKEGLLKEKRFKVIKNSGIAFDHPAFIVQALLYIKHLLGNK